MQIRVQVTPADIRKALDRLDKGYSMESPLSVALERDGYKGAVHSPNQAHPGMWCYDVTGKNYLRVKLTKRAMLFLSAWWKNKTAVPNTYILTASVDLVEPHFPGHAKGD